MLPRYPRQNTKSVKPLCAYNFMICQRMGRPPISTMGLGRYSVSSRKRVPSPPHSITTFTRFSWEALVLVPMLVFRILFLIQGLGKEGRCTRTKANTVRTSNYRLDILFPGCTNCFQHGRIDYPFSEWID